MHWKFPVCIIIIGVAFSGPVSSQTHTRSVTLSSIIGQALATSDNDDEALRIENANIVIDISGEKIREFIQSAASGKEVKIMGGLEFDNCSFISELDLQGLFLGDLKISNSSFEKLTVSDCRLGDFWLNGNKVGSGVEVTETTMKSLEIKDNGFGYELYMEADSVAGDTYLENNSFADGELAVIESSFKGSFSIGNNNVTGILIEKSAFELPHFGEFNNYKLPGNSANDLYLTGNVFTGDSTTHVYFNKGNYLNLDIRENTFNCNVYFIENNISDRFFLVDNAFNSHVSFEKFLFSETWNELYWKQLAGYKLRYIDYAGNTPDELRNEVEFKNLINIYKGLHTIFLSRGDLESANACYSEMKQMQGRMLRQVYRDEGGFGNFLRWQLNVLLKIYTNHGTDPGLAVVMSFIVILAFGVLYLFFPSEWDSDSIRRLMISYEKFLHREKKTRLIPLFVVFGSVLLTLVNAITLSINSFVTLGFGSIPTKGFARYLCIIEGFLGWFLLSIFTVALINQVLA